MESKRQNILVTGGAGYIGSAVTRCLLRAGHQVVVIDNLSTGYKQALHPSAVFVESDLADSETLNKVFEQYQFHAVVHLAASLIVEESVSWPLKYYANNVSNSVALIRSCILHGVENFVFSSTAAVYGSPKELPVTEASPTNPQNPYSRSKLMVEEILRDTEKAHPGKLRSVILRYFNVAGACVEDQVGPYSEHSTHLIRRAAQVACGALPHVTIFGTDYSTKDGTGVRDYIHVSDIASTHECAIQYLSKGGESATLNCGYGTGYSVREVLDATEKLASRKMNIQESGRRAGDSGAVYADNSKLMALLGWEPKFNKLEDICKSAIDWEVFRGATQSADT